MPGCCPECGREFGEDVASFCPHDGARLISAREKEQDPLVGRLLGGRYRLEARLGSGGMGTVFRARHTFMDRTVAVKVLRPELAGDEYAAARFRREARSSSRIVHENCVAVTDFGQDDDGLLYLVMEYLEGTTLWELLQQEAPLSWERTRRLAVPLLSGLLAAHRVGVVHRDLKPENVIVFRRPDGTEGLKILDFGLAKVRQQEGMDLVTALTQAGMVFGTPRYMSPEQADGREADGRSDIYAFGVILYQAVTGTLPFADESPLALISRHLKDPPEPPRLRRPDAAIPPEAEALILRCLEKDPDRRFPDCASILRAMGAVEVSPSASWRLVDGRGQADALEGPPPPAPAVTRIARRGTGPKVAGDVGRAAAPEPVAGVPAPVPGTAGAPGSPRAAATDAEPGSGPDRPEAPSRPAVVSGATPAPGPAASLTTESDDGTEGEPETGESLPFLRRLLRRRLALAGLVLGAFAAATAVAAVLLSPPRPRPSPPGGGAGDRPGPAPSPSAEGNGGPAPRPLAPPPGQGAALGGMADPSAAAVPAPARGVPGATTPGPGGGPASGEAAAAPSGTRPFPATRTMGNPGGDRGVNTRLAGSDPGANPGGAAFEPGKEGHSAGLAPPPAPSSVPPAPPAPPRTGPTPLPASRIDVTVRFDMDPPVRGNLPWLDAYAAGLRSLRLGEMAEADRFLGQAMLQGGADARVQTAVASLRLRQGRPAAARSALSAALRGRPDFLPAHLLMAAILLEEGDAEAARPHLRAVLDREPHNREAATLDAFLSDRAAAAGTRFPSPVR